MSTNKQRQGIVGFCQDLVRIPSLSGQEHDAAQAAKATMLELGYDEVWIDELGSVVGRIVGSKPGKTALFDGHLDTVAPSNRRRWKHDPFGGEESEGKIWGLGATDMKGPLAAMVYGLSTLSRASISGSVTVSCGVHEETSPGTALQKVIERTPCDYVVICEPSELQVAVASKGLAILNVETIGKPAHLSQPQLGVNAVYSMVQVIDRLQRMPMPTHETLGSGLLELFRIKSYPFPGTSISPIRCCAGYERRLTRSESQEQVLLEIRAFLAEGGLDARIYYEEKPKRTYTGAVLKPTGYFPGWVTDKSGELVLKASQGLTRVGIEPRTFVAPYCTNGTYSGGVAQIPTIILGPSSVRQAHIVDEYIEVDALVRAAEAYAAIASNLLAAS